MNTEKRQSERSTMKRKSVGLGAHTGPWTERPEYIVLERAGDTEAPYAVLVRLFSADKFVAAFHTRYNAKRFAATMNADVAVKYASADASTEDGDHVFDALRYQFGGITDHQTKALRSLCSDSTLRYRGPFRVYFNRKEDAPRVVSIDDGSHTWEILCKSVTIRNVELKSKYEASMSYPNPVFSLEGSGSIEVRDGCATIL